MKKYLFILLFLGTFIQKPFAQTFNWADTANFWGMSNTPIGCGVCTDDSDNVFVTGNMNSTQSFSLRKYNSNGVLRWSKTGTVYNAVTTDASGNCYITGGYFGGSFFEKYNSNGILIHNYSAGGSDGSSVTGCAISYDGRKYLYITGHWSGYGNGTASFGSQVLSQSSHNTSPAMFILKCDTAGNVLWVKSSNSWKSPGGCNGYGISANSNGLIYITGNFNDSVLVGGDSLNTNAPVMSYVACYDSNGNVKWAHSTGSYYSYGNAVSSDGAGNVYITGTAAGIYPAFFIAKYTSTGDSVWWRQCFSNNNEYSWGYGIATNSSGISYVTGGYEGAPFGSLTLHYGGNEVDLFIVEYDSSGNAIWGIDPNDTDQNSVDDYGCSVAVDKYGCNFYFTGITESPAQFGNTLVDEFYVTKLNNGCVTSEQNQKETKEAIQVYPNPFISSTTILFNETGKHQLEVEDMTGRILQQINCSGQQYELQKDGLANGIYFIKVTDEQSKVFVSKILVE